MKIFHHNDLDGIMAGTIAYQYFNEKLNEKIETIMINYDKEDETLQPLTYKENEIICMLDYSLSVENIKNIMKTTKNIIWLDHHKTAIEKYKEAGLTFEGAQDIKNSGCMLTWMYFHPEQEAPEAVKLIEDFDIWKWEWKSKTEPFKYSAEALPQDPKNIKWKNLLESENEDIVRDMIEEGKAITKYINTKNEQNVLESSYQAHFEGYDCIVINQLEKGSQTFEKFDNGDYEVLVIWRYNGEKYIVSLYHSQHHKDIDVSEIAKKYGGGGHKGACGFTAKVLPRDLATKI